LSEEKSYAKGYLKGYEEGMKEAWEQLISLTMKGYTAREIQVLAKSNRASIDSRLALKKRRLQGELGLVLDEEKEGAPESPVPLKVTAGSTYIIKDKKTDNAFAAFKSVVDKGSKGLCILRTHPATVRQRFGIETSMVWLTKAEAGPAEEGAAQTAEVYVSPTELPRLSTLIKTFLTENDDTIIILEGTEYLVTQNDFKSVLRFLQLLKDQIILAKSVLLMPIDPSTLDPKDLNLLEREIGE